MNPERQRIAIAEACGWHVSNLSINGRPDVVWVLYDPTGKEIAFGRDVRPKDLPSYAAVFATDKLPDYIHDLNAIHEAEGWMESKKTNLSLDYVNCLRFVIAHNGVVGDFRLINSTASQRAEAFLKTIGKWQE